MVTAASKGAEPEAEVVQPVAPVADPKTGKPGKLNWDNEKQDPNARKSIAEDPDGKANAKAFKK